MNLSSMVVAVMLTAAVNAAAVAPAAQTITLSGVTGVVKIKTADGSMTVKAGEPIPDIPAGAEIIIVSGDAVVESGGIVVKADAGDSFTVGAGNNGTVAIKVTGGEVTVTGTDNVSKDLVKGDSVSLAPKAETPVGNTNQTPAVKRKAPDSLPADNNANGDNSNNTNNTGNNTSATQESCNTVSPSAPCP